MQIAATWKLLQVEAERFFSETQLVPAAFRDLTVRNTVQRRSRSRTLLLVIPALVMACAAGYGWCYWTVGQFLESTGLCIFAIS
jgi:hypothetical protein